MELLNKQKANELFLREAVLIGESDVFPEYRAVQLFGEKAVKFAKRKAGEYFNCFFIGDDSVTYLTYRGFKASVSYYNVNLLSKEAI